jgi:two-component system response regulator
MKSRKPSILIAEDDQDDRLLMKAALDKVGVQFPVLFVNNGLEAIQYLNGDGQYADRQKFPFPTTIFTDLKMPLMDGFAVLEHVKHNRQWAVIPLVVLSASEDLDDIKRSYLLGASAYHIKPHNPKELRELLDRLMKYWAMVEAPQVNEKGEMVGTVSLGKLGERFGQS